MDSKEIIEIFNNQKYHLFRLDFILDGELRTAYYRCPSAYNATLWLNNETNGKAQVVMCSDSEVFDAIFEESNGEEK